MIKTTINWYTESRRVIERLYGEDADMFCDLFMRKACSKCGIEKPLSKFHRHPSTADKKRPDCRVCRNIWVREYHRTTKGKKLHGTYTKKYESTVIGSAKKRYRALFSRCNNPKNKDYDNYGGRGIKCEFVSADDFVDYIKEIGADLYQKEVHRIDNDGNYCRENIEFLCKKEHVQKHKFGCVPSNDMV